MYDNNSFDGFRFLSRYKIHKKIINSKSPLVIWLLFISLLLTSLQTTKPVPLTYLNMDL